MTSAMPCAPSCATSFPHTTCAPSLLRTRLLDGTVSKGHYFFQAARHFAAQRKPLRAQALLDRYVHYTGDRDSPSCRSLHNQIENLRAMHSPASCCSVAFIMRNEQHNCMAALQSIDSLADEIVVCDTGSDDRTVELVQLFGVRLHCIHWQNDFSTARNTGLDMCRCGWIIWMDADDRLTPDSHSAITSIVTHTAPEAAYSCVVANRNRHNQDTRFLQVRLFPNDPKIRFSFSVHEQLTPALNAAKIPIYAKTEITFRHHGYHDPRIHRQKAQRNLPLLHKEHSEHPENDYFRLYLAECYTTLGQYDNAAAQYRLLITRTPADIPGKNLKATAFLRLARLLIHGTSHNNGDKMHAETMLKECLRLSPGNADAHFTLGIEYYNRKMYDAAFGHLLDAVRATRRTTFFACNTTAIRYHGLYAIAVICHRSGHNAHAYRLIKQALNLFPNDPRFLSLYERITQQRKESGG